MNMPIAHITDSFKNMGEVTGIKDFKWSKQTEQNIPPRVRMTMLYAVAQTFNGRVVGTTNLDERLTGYFTKYRDGLACDLEPIEMLTVGEILKIGEYLGLPSKWLNRVPSADLPNTKTDEEELGFSYKDLDNYIRGINNVSEDVIQKIKDKINKNSFKLNGIAHFDPNLKIY
jgi:NAD+ synthase